jgi:UDP-3-O-[3-hydroxymyristoyl] glucosamine N-acyltransferase
VLEEGVVLSAHVSLAAGVVVGAHTVLMPGVVVRERCRIGKRCRIHSNAVIGTDGFGYFLRKGVHNKVPHVGTVEIGDDVEIGACVCIDRAKFGATRIGDGSKIDNLVQIGHNAQLGRGVLLAGLVGIAGSARVGDYAVLAGHAGVRDNATLGDRSVVAAYSVALSDVPADTVYAGMPAIPLGLWRRVVQIWTRLPEMRQQLKALQARLDALESKTNDDQR